MKRRAPQGHARVWWLGGTLVATLLVAQWVSGGDGGTDMERRAGEVVPAVETRASRPGTVAEQQGASQQGTSPESEGLQLERLERRKFSAQAGDVFRQQSWAPPPPPPSANPEPPAPPPLQFKYLGKIIEENEVRVFLALADRNYILKPGENINGQYRIDEVKENSITFTYLPLNAKQALSTAGGAATESF